MKMSQFWTLYLLVLCQLSLFAFGTERCSTIATERKNCGWPGIRNQTCTNIKCCYQETTDLRIPWCYYAADYPPPWIPRLSPRDAGLLNDEPEKCSVVNYAERDNCGFPRISRNTCESRGCCFDSEQQRFHWCFYPDKYFGLDSDKAEENFLGYAVLSRNFSDDLLNRNLMAFLEFSKLVVQQLTKALRYKVPEVKSVQVISFSDYGGLTKVEFETKVVASASKQIGAEQLYESSTAAIWKKMIGIVDYRMFVVLPQFVGVDPNNSSTNTDDGNNITDNSNNNKTDTSDNNTDTDNDNTTNTSDNNTDDSNNNNTDTSDINTDTDNDNTTNTSDNNTDDRNDKNTDTSDNNKTGTSDNNTDNDNDNSANTTDNNKDNKTDTSDKSTDNNNDNNTDTSDNNNNNNNSNNSSLPCLPSIASQPDNQQQNSSYSLCHSDASCVLRQGVYACQCDDGYVGDDVTCDDVDECDRDTHDCHALAECSNTEGGYECTCQEGFQGDGVQCEYVDECTSQLCPPNSACTKRLADFTCYCIPGFVQTNEENCTEQKIFRGTIPLPNGFPSPDPSSPLFDQVKMILEEQLTRLYNSTFPGKVKIEVISLEDNGTLLDHVIIFTGSGAHNITAADFNGTVFDQWNEIKATSGITIANGSFVELEMVEPEDYEDLVEVLLDGSALKEQLEEIISKQEDSSEKKVVFSALIKINPNRIPINSQGLLNITGDLSTGFISKLQRDLFHAYSQSLDGVVDVKVTDVLGEKPLYAGNGSFVPQNSTDIVFEATVGLKEIDSFLLLEKSSLNYTAFMTSLEIELRKSYEALLGRFLQKIMYEGKRNESSGIEQYTGDEKVDDINKEKNMNRPILNVVVTNVGTFNGIPRAKHRIFVKLPKIYDECTNETLQALKNLIGNNQTRLEQSLTTLQNITSDMLPGKCYNVVRTIAMLSEISESDMSLFFALSGLMPPEINYVMGNLNDITWVRKPKVIDLINMLQNSSDDENLNSTALVAKHEIVLLLDENDSLLERNILMAFLESVASASMSLENKTYIGLPYGIYRIATDKMEPDKKDFETKTFSASVDLSPTQWTMLLEFFEKDSTTYTILETFFEWNLRLIYEDGLEGLAENDANVIGKIKIEINLVELEQQNATLSALHTIKVYGQNLSNFDNFTLMYLFMDFVEAAKNASMFASELKNATLLGYDKAELKLLCDPLKGPNMTLDPPEGQICSDDALCLPQASTYNCTCKAGYDGDGMDCEDRNECALDLHACSVFAKCENEEGYYECDCQDGFEGDGFLCLDTDECTGNVANCDVNASCTNSQGSFECSCDRGFTGNGTQCTPFSQFYGVVKLNSSFVFTQQLGNASSTEFLSLKDNVIERLSRAYNNIQQIEASVRLESFSNGSVLAEHVVTLIGEMAHSISANDLLLSYARAALNSGATALNNDFKMFGGAPELTRLSAANGYSVVVANNVTKVLPPPWLDSEDEKALPVCLKAGIRINAETAEKFTGIRLSPCSISTEFLSKLQRNLFQAYSAELPNVASVSVDKIVPSRNAITGNPATWKNGTGVRFVATVLVTNGEFNFTQDKSLVFSLLEAQLRSAYLPAVVAGKSSANECLINRCDDTLLYVRIINITEVGGDQVLVDHYIEISLPEIDNGCLEALGTSNITTLASGNSFLDAPSRETSSAEYNCTVLVQRVLQLKALTEMELIESLRVATLGNDSALMNMLALDIRLVEFPEELQVAQDPKIKPEECDEMTAYHTVVYAQESDEEPLSVDNLEDSLEAFLPENLPLGNLNVSFIGLPFDVSFRQLHSMNRSSVWPTTTDAIGLETTTLTTTNAQLLASLAKLKVSLPPGVNDVSQIPYVDITEAAERYTDTTTTNGQPSTYMGKLTRDLRVAGSILLASRNLTADSVIAFLDVIAGLSVPVKSLLLSVLNTSSEPEKELGIVRSVAELIKDTLQV